MIGRDDIVRLMAYPIKVNSKTIKNGEYGYVEVKKEKKEDIMDIDVSVMKLLDKIFGIVDNKLDKKKSAIFKEIEKFREKRVGKKTLKMNDNRGTRTPSKKNTPTKDYSRPSTKSENIVSPLHIFLHALAVYIIPDSPHFLIDVPTLFTGDTPLSCAIRGYIPLMYPMNVSLPYPTPKFIQNFHIYVPPMIKRVLAKHKIHYSRLGMNHNIDLKSTSKRIFTQYSGKNASVSHYQFHLKSSKGIIFRNPLTCLLPSDASYILRPCLDWDLIVDPGGGIQSKATRKEAFIYFIIIILFIFLFFYLFIFFFSFVMNLTHWMIQVQMILNPLISSLL
jgi:hypothetical protein